MKAKKPSFKRQGVKARIKGKGWRKPRGIDSRQRKHKVDRGAHPKIGYSAPSKLRGLHPTGLKEVMIKTAADLTKIGEGMAARLYSKLGKKKREEIRKAAEKKKIKVLN